MTVLMLLKQLWNDQDAALEALTSWCCDLQCLRSLLQGSQPDATCWTEARLGFHLTDFKWATA